MELGVNEGWQQRLRAIKESFPINVAITLPGGELYLNDEETLRLVPKMAMVRAAAAKMVLNMIKGTIKYPADTWSADEWMACLIDDQTDALMYTYLLEAAMGRGTNERL